MWTIILFMALGVLVGAVVPMKEHQVAALGKLQSIGVILLLFVMGLSMGLDRKLLSQLSTLGYKALVYAGLTTAFSIAAVYLFTRKLGKKGAQQ
jgi:uncharacterized membrane protein YbjE (DUF340 family)